MNLETGQVYWSKKLNKPVIYKGQGTFVGVAYAVTYYLASAVGELDTMVRGCHYEAAMKSNERFVEALHSFTPHSVPEDYADGWKSAVDYVAKAVQVGS